MTEQAGQERALVAVRWDESALGVDRSERVREEVIAVARQLGMLGPELLSVVDRDHQRPGFALLVIESPPFEAAARGLATAERLYENLVGTWGEPVRIGADVRPSTRTDAELEQLLDACPEGFISLGARLVDRLSVDDLRELAARGSSHDAITYLFPAPVDSATASALGVLPHMPARLPHRFVRRGDAPVANEALTREGLLDPSAVRDAEPIEVLLRAGRTVLVLGQPWVGKTHCARALFDHERWARGGEERAFFPDLRLAAPSLSGDRAWDEWRASDAEATLVLDGVDEALFQGWTIEEVFQPVRALEQAERARLRLIVLTRDDATWRTIASRALPEATVFRLLPIDGIEARRALGDGLGRALERLAEQPDLAPRPVSMQWLRTLADPTMRPEDASEQVLVRICKEGIHESYLAGVSNQALLRVAMRLAAVLTFARLESVELDPLGLGVSLGDAGAVAGGDAAALRAFLRSAALARRAEGSSFRSRHTQELLAARAVATLSALVLRELMTDAAGRTRPELGAVADEIVRIAPHRREAIEQWRSAPLPALHEDAALTWIDRIAALSEPRMPWGVDEDVLARLDHPSVRDRAKAYLLDRGRPVRAREIMLDIAHALTWSELREPALEITLDGAEPMALRLRAAYFVRAHGPREAIERLRPLAAQGRSEGEEAGRLAAVVLQALLDEGLIAPLEAAASAPAPQRGLVDARSMLVHAIETRISIEDARALLGRSSGRLAAGVPVVAEAVLRRLVPAAVEKLAADDVTWDEQVASDLAAFVREDVFRSARLKPVLERRLERDADARQRLYRAMLGDRVHYVVRNVLRTDDADWLLALARSLDEVPVQLAEDLNHLLWSLSENTATRTAIEELLRTRFPARWAEWEEARRRAPGVRRKWQDERSARAATGEPRRALASVIDEVRADVEDATRRVRLLARLCFSPQWHRYTNVDGAFDALPRALRQAIVDDVRALLPRAEPSALPDGTSFSSTVVEDAAAFGAVVLWDERTEWLGEDLVRGWLPLVLFMHSESNCMEVVRRCLAAQHDATVDVVERCVATDVRRTEYPFVARELPLELWTERRFVSQVLRLLDDCRVAVVSREHLLLLAAARAPRTLVMPVLRRHATPASDLRLAAIAALVAMVPREGMRLAEVAIADVPTAASVLRVFLERGSDLPAPSLDRMATDDLFRLASVLVRHVSSEDPRAAGDWYSPTEEDELRELRSRVVHQLARRTDFEDVERLLACAGDLEAREGLRRWIEGIRDSSALERWFTDLAPETTWPSARRIVDALDGTRDLRMRSVDDLFAIVHEGLEATAAKDSFDYVELLRGVDSKAGARPWPHERSLQAYVELRIRGILALSHGHRSDSVLREVQEAGGADRLDFLLVSVDKDVAPGGTVELPLEVKWSHDAKCVQGLTEQLGRRYVVEKGRTHGLYVVGFTGETRSELSDLRATMEAARAEFERTHRVRLGVVFLPCVRLV